MKDYGFDLPDTRYSYIDTDGETVSIQIVRHWRYDEEETDDREPSFDVSFEIVRLGKSVLQLPIGSSQDAAEKIALELFPMDKELSKEMWDSQAMERAERRMGA